MSTKVKRGRPPGGDPARKRRGPASTEEGADPRRTALLRAAYEAFVERGAAGATTDEIARRAHVSKREIYRLFGSREALFSALVRERAAGMRRALTLEPPADRAAALETLERFGREFLTLLTAPTTTAVYRLAIGEAATVPELGRTLDAEGRGAVWGALVRWTAAARDAGALPVPDPELAAGSFMALLMADLPVRLALGAVGPPEPALLARRAALARAGFERLWLS